MHISRYQRTAGAVYNLHYHLVWCPTYRRAVLVSAVEARLKALLAEKAAAMDVQIEALDVMPDHVHLVRSRPANRRTATRRTATSGESVQGLYLARTAAGVPASAVPFAATPEQELLYRLGWSCL
jgi:REP element-mobilizing transposase RayT